MEEKMSDGVPQFTTAEYSGSANNTACKSCGQPISGAYYQVNGALTCSACAQQIKDQMLKDSHAAFARGVLFGSAAAVLGLVLYVTVALTTGLIIGFVSLAVGYMVGKAIIMGSGGLGGRRYQIAAVIHRRFLVGCPDCHRAAHEAERGSADAAAEGSAGKGSRERLRSRPRAKNEPGQSGGDAGIPWVGFAISRPCRSGARNHRADHIVRRNPHCLAAYGRSIREGLGPHQ